METVQSSGVQLNWSAHGRKVKTTDSQGPIVYPTTGCIIAGRATTQYAMNLSAP